MSTQLKTCFNGCSFTVGEGFPESRRDEFIYDRLLAKRHNFNRVNIAKPGSSNYTIFLRSCQAVLSENYDIVFSQWTGLNRLWLCPGPDSVFFINDEKKSDFTYRDIYLSPQSKQQLKDHLLILNHDYQNILDLIDYCRILTKLSDHCSTEIVFINGLVPWQSDLVDKLNDNLEKCLSDYTKEILDFANRDDTEITKFFTVLQEKFTMLHQSKWVNIFNPFSKNEIDVGPEGHHPGIKSHQWMADQISIYLEENKLL